MTNEARGASWLIDLDGVVWLAEQPIPGAREALIALHDAGYRVAYFTNNSFSSRGQIFEKFARHGIAVAPEDLLSSAQAAAKLLPVGAKVTVFGGEGIVEALAARNIEVLDLDHLDRTTDVDAVVVGLDPKLSFRRLTTACSAIERGASFIATNDDATFPTADGLWPGAGSLVAAVAYTTRTSPVVAGKPNPPAVQLVTEVLGRVSVVVGDRPETDGKLALGLKARFGLVRSGVTPADTEVDPRPDLDATDLAQLVAEELGVTREQILQGSGVS